MDYPVDEDGNETGNITYTCKRCGHPFLTSRRTPNEVATIINCPACGNGTLTKLEE